MNIIFASQKYQNKFAFQDSTFSLQHTWFLKAFLSQKRASVGRFFWLTNANLKNQV